MKWLCCLLALFFLCLDLEPCEDALAPARQRSTTTTIDSKDTARPIQDQCSPMCNCRCCGAQVMVTATISLQPVIAELPGNYPYRLPLTTVGRPSFVWQPPQLFV